MGFDIAPLTVSDLKPAAFVCLLLLTHCATTRPSVGHQDHHEHTLFESWKLVARECCGRASKMEAVIGQYQLTIQADSTYRMEVVSLTDAKSETGQVQFTTKGGIDYLKLGYDHPWGIYQIKGDTLILDYSYMDLQKETYIVTHGHQH